MSDLIDTTEMYLRTIYELAEEGIVPLRARIAERLGHSGPTVSQTVARMERDGLVVVSGDRHLELTEAGHLRDHGDERFGAVDPRPVDLERAWAGWDREKDRWLAEDAKRAQAVLVDTTLRALPDILTGRRPATDVMFPKTSLHLVEAVYKNNPVADYFNDVLADTLVDHLRRRIERDPGARLRILEIGAGTGGTSAVVFRRLQPWAEHVETYRYTDISKAFLLHAKKTYSAIAPYLDGRIFNAELPLAGQDTDPGQFDVVIATNVLHATRNIRTTLRNAKAAAKPNGVLLLNELSDNIVFSHLTFGLLDGWWLYDDPAPRIPGSPGLAPEDWRRVLDEVGFRSAFVGAEGADDLGQQVIVAESDGVVRQPREVSAFRGALPEAAAADGFQDPGDLGGFDGQPDVGHQGDFGGDQGAFGDQGDFGDQGGFGDSGDWDLGDIDLGDFGL